MNSPFKFLRRVRIHGGESGAVARALHHEIEIQSLSAVRENVSFTTNERKQMSTKITLKRIALVAVSALGFGLISSVAPASAAGATSGISMQKSSITVVGSAANAGESSTAFGAIFKITANPLDGVATVAHGLASGESLTATVVAVPAGTGTAKTLAANAADLVLQAVAPNTYANTGNPYSITDSPFTAESKTVTRSNWTLIGGGAAAWDSASTEYASSGTSTKVDNAYYLRVLPETGQGRLVIDQGEYQIRLRLTSNTGALVVSDTILKVNFVSSSASSGAIITASDAGNFAKSAAFETQSSTKFLRGTLTDANSGLIIEATGTSSAATPSVVADIVDATSLLAIGSGTVTAVDGGTWEDSGYSSTAVAGAAHANRNNGVYGVKFTALSLDTAVANSATANLLRVRYGAASSTTVLSIISAPGSTTAGTPTATGTGIPVTDVAPSFSVPLTTTSVTYKVTGATAGNGYVGTVTWTNCASAGQTPLTATATVYYADAAGAVSIPVTCANPIDATTAVVNLSGFGTNPADVTFTWRASAAATVSVDINGAYVALKAANTAVATVRDHFGNPVVGAVVTPSMSGAWATANSTATYAALTTNASGQVTYSWTDATAVAAGTDTVTFTVLGTAVSGQGVVTYAATAPAPTALTAFYNSDPTTSENANTIVTAVPTTGIYADGISTKFQVQKTRNLSRPVTVAASQDSLTLRVDGNARGAKITAATSTTGTYIIGSSNLLVTSRSNYADINGDVYFDVLCTLAGANTVTFTSGTVTTSASFWCESSNTNTRFVTVTGATTGTANGALLSYTVSVTDRFGNPMNSKTVSISTSGVAVLSGGANVASYTTDASGTFAFAGTSLNAAGGAGSFIVSVSGTDDMESTAGKSGSSTIDSTVLAGNSKATVAVTFAAGTDAAQAAAEAASDAAAEAIDAANAATDAANLAAEAADAATVAAEEARDAADAATAAVEELATQVATLMAALKAQITTLANTVAKIAKKVKA